MYVVACISTLFLVMAKCFSTACCVLFIGPRIFFYDLFLGLSVSLEVGMGPSPGESCGWGANLTPLESCT